MDEIRQPHARDWAIPLMIGAAMYMWASTRTVPTTFSSVVMVISFVFDLWAVFNGIQLIVAVASDQWRENRLVDFKFTQNFKLEVMSHMTEYQVKAVRAGKFMIDVIPTDSGPVELIRGTNVTSYAAWYILTRSTDLHVYPINNFMKDTYHMDVIGDHATDDYTQAREFHSWLYEMGIGEWGRGNTSMSWVKGWNPKKVMDGFGWDEDTYNE